MDTKTMALLDLAEELLEQARERLPPSPDLTDEDLVNDETCPASGTETVVGNYAPASVSEPAKAVIENADLSNGAAPAGEPAAEDFVVDESLLPSAKLGSSWGDVAADRVRAVSAFGRMASGGRIATDLLARSLKFTGHNHPDLAWVKRITEQQFPDQFSLSRPEYFEFIDAYDSLHREHIESMFIAADSDGSGFLSAAELSSLLRRVEVSPLPGVVEELMREVLDTAAPRRRSMSSAHQEVGLQEFVRLEAILRDRAGITRKETERLRVVFDRYTGGTNESRREGGEGQLTALQLRAALCWLDFDLEETEQAVGCRENSLVSFPPIGENDTFAFAEFLTIVRGYRGKQVSHVLNVFCEQDVDHSGSIDLEELDGIFLRCGYLTASPAWIDEVLQACGLAGRDDLIFEEIWQVVEQARDCEGFMACAHEEIEWAFTELDIDDSGGLDAVEFAGALRLLAMPVSLDQINELFARFDVDEDGCLDQREFLRLAAECRERHAKILRASLAPSGTRPPDSAFSLLSGLGHRPTREEAAVVESAARGVSGGRALGIWQWHELIEQHRKRCAHRAKESRGFSAYDIQPLRACFQRAVAQGGGVGRIHVTQVGDVLGEVSPNAWRVAGLHARVGALTRKLGAKSGERLDFDGFLQIARLAEDILDRYRSRKEQKALQEVHFSREEVEEFKGIFKRLSSGVSGTLSFAAFEQLLATIVKVDDEVSAQLRSLMWNMSLDTPGSLDFADFLRVWQRVQETDWGSINTAAAAIARREERRQQRLSSQEAVHPSSSPWKAAGNEEASGAAASWPLCGSFRRSTLKTVQAPGPLEDDLKFCRSTLKSATSFPEDNASQSGSPTATAQNTMSRREHPIAFGGRRPTLTYEPSSTDKW